MKLRTSDPYFTIKALTVLAGYVLGAAGFLIGAQFVIVTIVALAGR
jgi:hypothetical protein